MKPCGDGGAPWAEELAGLLERSGDDGFYRLVYCRTCDSTNECVKREAAKGAPEGLLVVGEEQTAGKGRSGRRWVSPKGEAVYFSFLLRPGLAPDHVSALTLVMGLSVAQAVRELFPGTLGPEVGIKWPNDIVIRGRKICGILTEAGAEDGRIDWIVIGTGINVNNTAFAPEIRDRAVSLRLALEECRRNPASGSGEDGGPGRDSSSGNAAALPSEPAAMPPESPVISRAEVTAAVLARFHRNYGIYLETGDMEGLTAAYDSLLVSRDREVRIEDPSGAYTAVSRGIDRLGRLAVEREDGTVEYVSAGEVSVRGIFGYV